MGCVCVLCVSVMCANITVSWMLRNQPLKHRLQFLTNITVSDTVSVLRRLQYRFDRHLNDRMQNTACEMGPKRLSKLPYRSSGWSTCAKPEDGRKEEKKKGKKKDGNRVFASGCTDQISHSTVTAQSQHSHSTVHRRARPWSGSTASTP